jgi:hypothetical protein
MARKRQVNRCSSKVPLQGALQGAGPDPGGAAMHSDYS